MRQSKFYDQYWCFIVIFYNVITMEVFLEIPKEDIVLINVYPVTY